MKREHLIGFFTTLAIFIVTYAISFFLVLFTVALALLGILIVVIIAGFVTKKYRDYAVGAAAACIVVFIPVAVIFGQVLLTGDLM